MVILAEMPRTIPESTRAAQEAGLIEVSGRSAQCSDISPERSDGEIPIAEATLHIVAAYRHLHDVVARTLPPEAIPSFRAVCDSLCSTVVAMDELTATLWGLESA
jgi:hypothetical protein